jgi:hypothetical protein
MPIIAAAVSGPALSLFVLFAIGLYFFPTVIASVRKHRSAGAVFALNLLPVASPGHTVVVNQYVNPGDAGVNVREPSR